MSRKPVFDAIKQARGGKSFMVDDVREIDALLDRLGIVPDGPAAPPQPVKPPASITAQIPADYWPMLSKIESGDRPYIKAATSTGSGLYQFIRSTWIGEGGQWGTEPGLAFGGLKPSVEEQLQRAKTFTAKNAAYLAGKGIPINKASLYAAHFFGAGTAAQVIGADVQAMADAIAGPVATKANPSILKGKTVGMFLQWLKNKTGEWAR